MRKLDRYVGSMVLNSILLMLLVLVGIFTFFTFGNEMDEVGTGQYGALTALQYALLQVPRVSYELFPFAVLLGCLMGLGLLGNSNELTVMRASGVSVARILWGVMKVLLLPLVAVLLLGEKVAPFSEQYAQKMRASSKAEQISLQTEHGFWMREGNNFVNIRRVETGGRLEDVFLYRFDENGQGRLLSMAHAERAYYQEGSTDWDMENVTETRLNVYPLITHTQEKTRWASPLSPGLSGILILKPNRLSTLELYRYVSYLKENKQHATQYELALWQRLIYPLTVLVMLFLAVPFVFGSQRSVAISQRMLVGALLGVTTYFANQSVGYTGVIYGLSPALSAILPTLLFLVFGLALTQRRIA